ncbi:MAG TPA: hypothetical protein VM425_15010 [Myxococcota bacterium]|nr:hypothetical protein [Myxococcota bacterium]
MERPVFHVVYHSPQTLERDCKAQIKLHGLLLRTEAQLDQFAAVSVCVHAPDGEEIELSGEVVQVVPGLGLAVQFGAESGAAIEKLIAKASGGLEEGEPVGDDPEFFAPGQEPPGSPPDRITQSRNLQDQIAEMNVAQMRAAALHGRKDMRMLLIRDRNKTIHPFIIKNPAITLDEIEQIAKMPSVNPDVLRIIAKSREWNRSVTVCRNLVRNPKTPIKEALALMAKLPLSDIRAMAKSGNVRTPIQQAARKKLAG